MTRQADAHPPADLEQVLRAELGARLHTRPSSASGIPVDIDIVARDNGTLAGLAWVEAVLHLVDPDVRVEPRIAEGARITTDTPIARIQATSTAFTRALPFALSYLQIGSAFAGQARDYVKRVQGTGAAIRACGDALPSLEALARYALAIGGGQWPDHAEVCVTPIDYVAAGSVTAALDQAHAAHAERRSLTAVVETLEALDAALETNIDGVLLTDMASHVLTRAVNMAAAHRRRFRSRLMIEATGAITLGNVREAADTGVDAIRVPDLTRRLVGPAFRAVPVQTSL